MLQINFFEKNPGENEIRFISKINTMHRISHDFPIVQNLYSYIGRGTLFHVLKIIKNPTICIWPLFEKKKRILYSYLLQPNTIKTVCIKLHCKCIWYMHMQHRSYIISIYNHSFNEIFTQNKQTSTCMFHNGLSISRHCVSMLTML